MPSDRPVDVASLRNLIGLLRAPGSGLQLLTELDSLAKEIEEAMNTAGWERVPPAVGDLVARLCRIADELRMSNAAIPCGPFTCDECHENIFR